MKATKLIVLYQPPVFNEDVFARSEIEQWL